MMIQHRPSRRAFTLLELLVVITILLVLIGLFIGAGVAITGNQKKSQTRGVLEALNRALDEYMIANANNIPPFVREAYACVPGGDGPYGSRVDGSHIVPDSTYMMDTDSMPQRPDASVFIRQARGIGAVDSILSQLPSQFLIVTAIPEDLVSAGANCPIGNLTNSAPSVVDAWAVDDWQGLQGDSGGVNADTAWPILEQSLIYYVHPNNRRDRSAASSLEEYADAQELYGSCVNGRPYFFSAGPDGFYGHPREIPEIVARFNLTQRQGENDDDYWNRALREARNDNLYSAPIDIDFRVNVDVIQALMP